MTSAGRLARLAALAIWASFFAMLWVTGNEHRYLGSRTMWVIPFGAVVTASIAAMLAFRPARPAAPLRRGEALGICLLLAPVLVALVASNAELGAAAAERRVTNSSVVVRPRGTVEPGANIGYADVMFAQQNPRYGVRPGAPVRLIGFVMRTEGTPDSLFQVARFYLTCCVADATVLYATVDAHGQIPARDSWLDVNGTLERRDGQLIVSANRVRHIPSPEYPYLTAEGAQTTLPAIAGGTQPPDPRTAQPPPPYHPPKPPPTLYTLPAASTSQDAITITVDRVEFASTETRVFVTVANRTSHELTIFPTNSSVGGSTTAYSRAHAFTATSGSGGGNRLRSTLVANAASRGVLTFPRLSPTAPLRIVFDVLSVDPDVGDNGAAKIELVWHDRATRVR
jgi:uncharacterized repeat protein (TIGR03943 family)